MNTYINKTWFDREAKSFVQGLEAATMNMSKKTKSEKQTNNNNKTKDSNCLLEQTALKRLVIKVWLVLAEGR